jgi:hypothetical protein
MFHTFIRYRKLRLMNYFLLINTLFLSTLSVFSQNSGYTYMPFGYRTSYEPGYYYTTEGEKISGLIKWKCSGYSRETGANYILFRPVAGEKKVRLTTKQVNAFVVGQDSFGIIKSVARSGMTQYDKDFARIVVTGYITLYSHCQETKAGGAGYGAGVGLPGMTSTGIECFYFIKKDGVLYRLKRKDFKDTAVVLFGDNTTLMNEINNGVTTFDNIERVVAEYNTWKAAK